MQSRCKTHVYPAVTKSGEV